MDLHEDVDVDMVDNEKEAAKKVELAKKVENVKGKWEHGAISEEVAS